MTREKALEHKALGNTEFQAQNYPEAVKHFTNAIAEDDTDHVFYSNRSACYSSLNEYDKALADGKKCVELKPDWAKGYTRKGLAEYFLGKYADAESTYEAGLKLAPEDKGLQEGLDKVKSAKASGGGGAGSMPMGGMDMSRLMQAMQRNPKIAEYLQDKELMQKFQKAQQNPAMMQQLSSTLMQDKRLLELFMAMQGMDMPEEKEPFAPEPRKEETKAKKAKVEEVKVDDRTTEQKEADALKDEGNKLYKAKNFDAAIEQYDKAIATYEDLTYYNNKAAVLLEQKKFEECEKLLKDVVDRRYDINEKNKGAASFEKVGKVCNRLASCFAKQHKYDDAILYYQKSVTEDNNRQTRAALAECKKDKIKHEKEAYVNPELAEEHKEKGNNYFKENKFVDAKKEYDEACKRNPRDAKLFCNRAAALTKLMAHPDALKDLEETIKLDPAYVKAYSRKGACHFFMKDYNKALKSYEDGLKIDANDEGCKRGRQETMMKIQMSSMGGDAPDQQQVQEAMKDPEIQNILKDPQMRLILEQMQQNPGQAQEMINKDPKIANAVQKLMEQESSGWAECRVEGL
eukprot:CAMPEP_0178995436 /NCGR_PEP_ID=MMETSP0795-20121207/7827_1 /TAXON_ID=88552 /ORGANISM="Amoebophrya sp., Strain Ameob2" /LENGTH=572 /DNA_ID=CAMNT_0020687745 /DNA_START=101 /DNA_END=1820 /DNA_ORIENTATION=+